jgi:hypothetical protein
MPFPSGLGHFNTKDANRKIGVFFYSNKTGLKAFSGIENTSLKV